MNDIELKEFEEVLLVIDSLVQEQSQTNANIVRREIRRWIESKKAEWQREAREEMFTIEELNMIRYALSGKVLAAGDAYDLFKKFNDLMKKRGYTQCWKCGTWHNTVGHCFVGS